jgi:hypothetical protein
LLWRRSVYCEAGSEFLNVAQNFMFRRAVCNWRVCLITVQPGEAGSLTFPATPIRVAYLNAANHTICAFDIETVYIAGVKYLELKRNYVLLTQVT